MLRLSPAPSPCRLFAVLVPALVTVLASGCAPPITTATAPTLEHDYFIPATSGIGKREQAVTFGDGPNGEQVLFEIGRAHV